MRAICASAAGMGNGAGVYKTRTDGGAVIKRGRQAHSIPGPWWPALSGRPGPGPRGSQTRPSGCRTAAAGCPRARGCRDRRDRRARAKSWPRTRRPASGLRSSSLPAAPSCAAPTPRAGARLRPSRLQLPPRAPAPAAAAQGTREQRPGQRVRQAGARYLNKHAYFGGEMRRGKK
jgi:hypothetical protein